MTPADIDRVFGRGRLRMVTGDHVEVFREEARPGERRRYTKRFLATAAGDFSEWTEREWRILARLVGHGIKPVPDVVRFDRGDADRPALVQTYDAGVTVDHWATLLPLERDGTLLRNVFEDCAHWWALARHCLVALDAIHELRLVHLDLKADNVCIPIGPAEFDPRQARALAMHPRFDDIALIDFAFSLVSGERLDSALPIAQQADYEYQSPRLLRALEAGREGDLAPTRQLDWRCDLFSLAAMLWRYLPELEDTTTGAWSRPRHAKARALVRRLIEAHDAALPATRPHAELIALAAEPLEKSAELSESLQRGWTLAIDGRVAAAASPTPITRIARPVPTPITVPLHAGAGATTAAATTAPPARVGPLVQAVPIARVAPLEPEREPAAPLRPMPPDAVRHSAGPESLAVDPTEVAMRMQARQRARRERTRRLAWGAGFASVVAATAAGVALLEPAWLSAREERDLHLALAAQTRPAPGAAAGLGVTAAEREPTPRTDALRPGEPAAPEEAAPAPAAAGVGPAEVSVAPMAAAVPQADNRQGAGPTETAPPSAEVASTPAATAAPAATPTETGTGTATPARAPALAQAQARGSTASDAVDRKAAAVAPVAPSRADPARTRTGARGRATDAPTGKATPTPTRTARAVPPVAPARATPAAAPVRVARGGTPPTAALRPTPAPTRVAASPPPRRPAAADPWPAQGAPIPWAVAGRTAPRPSTAPVAAAAQRPATPAPPTANPPVRVAAAPSPAPAPTAGPSTSTSASATATAAPTTAPTPAPASTLAAPATDAAPVDYAVRASDLMAHHVPRLAQRAERLVARVLFVAGRSDGPPGDDDIRVAAASVRRDAGDGLSELPVAAREAQRLGAAARAEYARRGGSSDAVLLQARAFGANPLDADAAGHLAFLLLRQRPAQPEAARQLALHALTLHPARQPEGRIEDWATFAIASALSGRERDARNAFLVVLSLAPDVDRQCKAALDVYALYGERLRVPVEGMLQSANASGRVRGSSCEYPPRWTLTGGASR